MADLATWNVYKKTYFNPNKFPANLVKEFAEAYGPNGSATTGHFRHAIGKGQKDYFSPLGVLLSAIYTKLAWMFPDMRLLEEYFRKVNLSGSGMGHGRSWNIDIYSKEIREKVYNYDFTNVFFDEWQLMFI